MWSVLSLSVILCVLVQTFETTSDTHALWNKFKSKHSKDYHPHEEPTRRVVFEEHLNAINDHNLKADMGESTFRQGLNPFSDIPHDEFVKTMNGYRRSKNNTLLSKVEVHQVENLKLPNEVNWVKQGLVSSVKNQGSCGSCWTFSTAGAVEGAYALKKGELFELSKQHLLDCSRVKGNYGCNGGEPAIALQWVIDNGGLDLDGCYSYKGEQGKCRQIDNCIEGKIHSYKRVPKGDELALKEALSRVGPISVAMDASRDSLMRYRSGVYSESQCDPEYLDHAVLLVGYGTEGGQDYWLVKNSWGTFWGEKGYFKIARNKGNMCGIATEAFYGIA